MVIRQVIGLIFAEIAELNPVFTTFFTITDLIDDNLATVNFTRRNRSDSTFEVPLTGCNLQGFERRLSSISSNYLSHRHRE